MGSHKEKEMTLVGEALQTGDVMTIRVALNNFLVWLNEEDNEVELGAIGPAYRKRVEDLLRRLSIPAGRAALGEG